MLVHVVIAPVVPLAALVDVVAGEAFALGPAQPAVAAVVEQLHRVAEGPSGGAAGRGGQVGVAAPERLAGRKA